MLLNYTKSTDGINYSNTGGEPHEPATFEISKVLWQDTDITEMLNTENYDFDSIEEDCINEIEQ